MTSSSFAEAGRGPNSTAAPYNSNSASTSTSTSTSSTANQNHNHNHNNNPIPSNNSSFSSDSSIFHAHRQNHNSSKLPAFRFADLKKDTISLPSLLQHIPPSPVSPKSTPATLDENQQKAHEQPPRVPGSSRDALHHHNSAQNLPRRPASFETQQQVSVSVPTRSRSFKFQLPSAAASSDPSIGTKRPASFPDTPRVIGNVYAARSQLSYVATPVTKRRLTASPVVHHAATPTESRAHLNSNRHRGPKADEPGEAGEATPAPESATKEWAQGQRELLLPRAIDTSKTEDKKASRPPISYKPPITASNPGSRAVIPPIRSFRSSGSRKSVAIDMHNRRVSEDSFGEEVTDPNQRDRALRALEGRTDDDFAHAAPPESGDLTTTTDNDNTADIFMRIAGEDTARRAPPEGQGKIPEQNVISRIARSAHRRPLSAAIPSSQTTSPPQISRRLSDQRESARARANSQSAQQMTRELAYRTTVRENQPSATVAAESSSRAQPGRTPLKPSPITPRQISFQDSLIETASAYQRRRQSITENNNLSTAKTTQYRSSNLPPSQSRAYNSSPLVPRSSNVQKDEPQPGSETNQGVEGTESSSSTAAPSTVWDELDDLKSRIHRLELTGKMPPTSGATTSRTSDDRPPTATTNATTMSASPKRGSNTGAAQVDASSSASFNRETQPLLLSALTKTKGLVSSDVFSAIESAAMDALALSSMMGAPGQPGPISSGASTIGFNGGVTDRQLRRKAESICRSLTELCIALTGDLGQHKQSQSTAAARENELLLSPTSIKPAAASGQMRPSALAETVTKPSASPRAPTTLEQRRQSMLATTVLPSTRYAASPTTPMEPMSAGRKSSLLLARIRRAATEEPEEQPGRRSSLLLRARRAGTEEPEESREGRKTSLLLRSRKNLEDDDESRFRAPSRAITEVNSFRAAAPRDAGSANPQSPAESSPAISSALPRRRLLPASLNTRLITITNGSGPASAPVTPARRYLERGTPEREAGNNIMAEKYTDERGQRQPSLSQTAMLNRTGSLSRRTRESGIPSLQSPLSAQFAQAGGSGSERSGREGGGGYYR
ncbi:LPXTG-motif cell wall anchor domain protein [Madurella fahalii]|uniref:LPXTG-motif cell wall anchor domain protein n=1 Tax=Madurella fahalii TaxID=1157608 RepID=A0ABQ0GS74_9PEZI